jgi:hypothetical protein
VAIETADSFLSRMRASPDDRHAPVSSPISVGWSSGPLHDILDPCSPPVASASLPAPHDEVSGQGPLAADRGGIGLHVASCSTARAHSPPCDVDACFAGEPLDAGAAPSVAPSEDAATLVSLLRQFRLHLDDPLLPLPDPKVV